VAFCQSLQPPSTAVVASRVRLLDVSFINEG
jgi:hypothetical protein